MTKFLEGKTPERITPSSDVMQRAVCVSNGSTPPEEGCQTKREYFLKGYPVKQPITKRERVFIDKTTGDLAAPGQTENVEEKEETIIIDPLGNRYCLSCPHPTPTPTPGT